MNRPRASALAVVFALFVSGLVQAADQIHTFTGIHLGGDFNDPTQWTPSTVPDSDDTALIIGDLVDVTKTQSVGKLIISSIGGFGGQLHGNGHKINVNGLIDLDGTGAKAATPVELNISDGPGLDFETVDMKVEDGARLFFNNGGLRVNNDLLVDEQSLVTGRGFLGVMGDFNLQGTIRPTAGTLTLSNETTGKLHLDNAPSTSLLDVTDGQSVLLIDGPLADPYNGRIDVGDKNRISFEQGWTLGAAGFFIPAGRLNLHGGASAAEAAVLDGTDSQIRGNIDVTGRGQVISPITFFNTANVTIAADAALDLNGQTTYEGGKFTGGRINQNGDVLVFSSTTIEVDHFNMDGNQNTNDWYINPNQTLTLNVGDLVDSGNEFNGQITFPSFSKLVVNTAQPWDFGGKAIVNGQDNVIFSMLDGQDVTVSGLIQVDGATEIDARIHLTGDITTKDADAAMRLGGGKEHTIAGGEISGPGRIMTTANSSLTGHGLISARVAFFGDLMAEGGQLNVSGTLEDAHFLGARTTGVLNVTKTWNTSIATQLRLEGGEVKGAAIINDGTTFGHGKISAHFVNNANLTADGGTLVLDEPNDFPDLDGSGAEDGVLNALTGDLYIKGDPAGVGGFDFGGELNIGAGHKFQMDVEGLAMSGKMTMIGGTYQAPMLRMPSSGVLSVTSNATLKTASAFDAGSKSNLDADLLIDGSAVVANGATFSGAGSLVVGPGSTLSGAATIGVDVVNQGAVLPGLSPGVMHVQDYTQTASGKLQIEIGGKTAGTLHDQLQTAAAHLDGALQVQLVNGFAPSYGDSFKVLTFSSHTGTFDTVPGGLTAGGKALVPIYGSNDVTLFTAVPGDTDLDGDVDLTDFGALKAGFGNAPATWANGDTDQDGDVDLSDFGVLKANFGTNVNQAAAVPEPATFLLLALGGLMLWLGSRRRAAD